jgi:hypothetical protein
MQLQGGGAQLQPQIAATIDSSAERRSSSYSNRPRGSGSGGIVDRGNSRKANNGANDERAKQVM